MVSPTRLRLLVVLCAFALLGALAPAALGHEERATGFPDGAAGVPEYRTDGPALVVCKPDSAERFALLSPEVRERNVALLAQCEFDHIQEAIDAVTERGTRILVLPGHYREEPSLADPPAGCAEHYQGTADAGREGYVMEYEEQLACPHAQNLIAIMGDPDGTGTVEEGGYCGVLCDLQLEGTGEHVNDVVVDADYSKLNGIRADRADGFGIFNMTVQRTEFNAVYILEQDGFIIDNVLTRWNYEYGFLTFSVDNGLYQNCEGYGNGDSTLYPGSAADLHTGQESHDIDELQPSRYATVIRNCVSHHNAMGYSGTAGNSVYVHDTLFTQNGIGLTTDSLFPDHPGLPQDHARWENNRFVANNNNYYGYYTDGEDNPDGNPTCHEERPYAERGFEHGVVCPNVPVPVGSGLMIAGGNWNLIKDNDFYDNWRYGGVQFSVPAYFRGEESPDGQFDTSHYNHWRDNNMGLSPEGHVQPQGTDFWWDDQGEGNCWQGNEPATGEITSNSPHFQPDGGLPDCDSGGSVAPPEPLAAPLLAKTGQIAPCVEFDRYDNPEPTGCPWMTDPEIPEGRQPEQATVVREAGDDRIRTAIALSQANHHMTGEMAGEPHNVVIARADDYADALVGAPLARRLGAPILLTGRDGLSAEVVAELERLNAARAFVLGGTAALGEQVVTDLRAAGVADVQRLAGPDRFATSAVVARLLGGSQAYLVQGMDDDPARGWPDAVAVSGLAAAQLRPILLTTDTALPASTRQAIDDLGVRNLSIVGGTVAVSQAVEDEVADRVPYVERLAGENRYETSAAVAERSALNVMDPNSIWLATGQNFPDALAAGAAVGYEGGILLLVDGAEETFAGPAAEWLDARYHPTDRITVVGGPVAISEGLEASLEEED